MTKGAVRLPRDGVPILDIHAYARFASLGGRFSPAQVALIARTARRIPEVMVKVTGGGANTGAVKARFAYISRKGRLEIETETGDRIAQEQHKAFLADWHLELSAGQYRKSRKGQPAPRDWLRTSYCRCRTRHHPRRCWRRLERLRGKSLPVSIGTLW
jgi:hypothetical protein